jgi:hypothetical protein
LLHALHRLVSALGLQNAVQLYGFFPLLLPISTHLRRLLTVRITAGLLEHRIRLWDGVNRVAQGLGTIATTHAAVARAATILSGRWSSPWVIALEFLGKSLDIDVLRLDLHVGGLYHLLENFHLSHSFFQLDFEVFDRGLGKLLDLDFSCHYFFSGLIVHLLQSLARAFRLVYGLLFGPDLLVDQM